MKANFPWDFLLGVRFPRYDVDIERKNLSDTVGGSIDWADPIIGSRFVTDISPCFDILLQGDIGGFDLGSHFSWQLMGGIRYHFPIACSKGTLLFLYKALDQNYDTINGTGKSEVNMLMHGPLIGLAFCF